MCRLPLEAVHRVPATKPAAGASAQGGGRPQQYDDEFLQFTYKVVPCDKTWRHDYATCPFAHPGESSERRHPSTYLPFMCGSTQHSTDLKEKCPFGTACKYAHGHFELWLHPGRFRTKLCSLGENCKRPVCFFAHSEQELRVTPYSKLDTAAAVAAQQLAEMGQILDANACGSLLGSSSSLSSELKARAPSSLASPGSSECGHTLAGVKAGSSSSSPANSISCDEAAALASLTASMAALGSTHPAAAMLDVGGIAQLQGNPYLAVSASAVDASLPGSGADLGMWPLGTAASLPQQQLPAAGMAFNGAYLQPQLNMLDSQLLGLAPGSTALPSAAAAASDVWMMPPHPVQWPPAAAAAPNVFAQQQQLGRPSGIGAGIPMQSLLGPAALDQWLQLDMPAKDSNRSFPMPNGLCRTAVGCGSIAQQQQAPAVHGNQAQMMQQLLNNQAVQQLLGLLEAQGAH